MYKASWNYSLFSVCVLVLALAFGLTSCGYQSVAYQLRSKEKAEVSIPLIQGDENGSLRYDLAKQLSQVPGFRYSSDVKAQYRLDVKILQDASETIGYVWDEDPITGAFIKRLYPNEKRHKLKVSVSLFDTVSNKIVVPTFQIEDTVDFDFVNPTALKNIEFKDIQGNRQSVLQYSLGQLDSEEGAKQESFEPLSKSISDQMIQALRRAIR